MDHIRVLHYEAGDLMCVSHQAEERVQRFRAQGLLDHLLQLSCGTEVWNPGTPT